MRENKKLRQGNRSDQTDQNVALTGELLWPPPPDVAEGEEVAKPIPTLGPRLNGLLIMLASLSQYTI